MFNPDNQSQVKTSQENYRPITFMNIENNNPPQNISKLNLATHKKDYTPWPSGIYPRNTKLVQHMTNQHSTPRIQDKKHVRDHHNWHRKSIWQNPTPFHHKNTQHTRNRRNVLKFTKGICKKNPQLTSYLIKDRQLSS